MCLLEQVVCILHLSLYNRDWFGKAKQNRGRTSLKIDVVQRRVGVFHRHLVYLYGYQIRPIVFRYLEGIDVVPIRTARRRGADRIATAFEFHG